MSGISRPGRRRRTTRRSSSRCRPARTGARAPCPSLHEGLAAEARKRVGKADRRVHVVRVHVGEAFGLLPAPGADRVEGRDTEGEVAETDRRREPREGRDEIVVVPDVAPVAVGAAQCQPPRRLGAESFPSHAVTRGPRRRTSRAAGRSTRSGGSTTWSSTEMIHGNSALIVVPLPYRGVAKPGHATHRPPRRDDPCAQAQQNVTTEGTGRRLRGWIGTG